jgi:hypothetical protein
MRGVMRVLYEVGDTIKAVYFPIKAVVSLVVTLSTGETTEASCIAAELVTWN